MASHPDATSALDGPISYSGRSLVEAHAGRGIEVRHFARFVDHLLATLTDRGFDEHRGSVRMARHP